MIQTVGDQDQVTANGTAADGSPIAMKYEVPDKGGTGKLVAGPFDAVSGKRIDDHTSEVSFIKSGKEMLRGHMVVSKDGKTARETVKGTNPWAILLLVCWSSENNSLGSLNATR